MASETGQRIGDYEVLALLGSGGMGRVYKVRNVISNREEAMKILLPDFASEPELAARFMAEIRTLAGLEHPNIAQLRTAFQTQDQFVMVMEFVEGTTLERGGTEPKIPLDQVLDYSMQVLSALSYAHSRGVTHRDIKPANIMITSHGLVKLMDFGIAKSTDDLNLTRPGTTMGSVYYMPPEQVRGGTIDARSDLYSFGVTLYEILTGRKPFQADTSYSVLNAQLNDAPTPPAQIDPSLPAQLNDIVLRAMVKSPDGRFQTADEFRNALKALREKPPVQTVPQFAPQPVPQSQGFPPVAVHASTAVPGVRKSNRGTWMGMGAVAAVLATVAAAALLPHFFAMDAGHKLASSTDMQAASTGADNAAPQSVPGSDLPQQPNPSNSAASEGSSAISALASGPSATGAVTWRPAANKPQHGAVSVSHTPAARPAPAALATSAPAALTGPSPQALRQAHDRMMNLDARASAASSGVQQIRTQQQAQGLDMRGDILASMNRLSNFMNEANRALQQNDIQVANEYMERADTEISTLERFLGR